MTRLHLDEDFDEDLDDEDDEYGGDEDEEDDEEEDDEDVETWQVGGESRPPLDSR